MTFYYDNDRSSRPGTSYDLNTGTNYPGWATDGTRSSVTKVAFDPSFADARPTTTYAWFYGMQILRSIEGLENLNTSEVTNMAYMFYDCNELTSLDLSSFNTSKVTSMSHMFDRCVYLTSIDLSGFNTARVEAMDNMFNACISLQTIYAGNGWSTAAVTESENMFNDCIDLVGGQCTTYDRNHIDKEYAHIDGGPSYPGYFTAKNTGVRGDVNSDYNVDISDVTALIDLLLVGDTFSSPAADCDLDGDISIADVTALIDFLLSDNWPVPEMVYTVAGVESVFGSSWDLTDENNDMVKGVNGVYIWTKENVTLTGNFEFKVVGDHDWSVYEWPIGMDNNYVANVAQEGIYTIVITFNPEAAEADRITCTLTKTGDIEHVYTVVGTYNLFENDWDLNDERNNMIKGADGIYRLTKAGYFTEGTEIKFKIVQDHSYTHSWPAEDWLMDIYETGVWNFEIMFNPAANDEDKIAVDITKLY